ncbi:hypothetical protein BDBG_08398 [Blastomyces gilchristii SLH14081]|uniref:Uncharacterized protein n=1 Tax=Blastomyces gilchristii (strain SLH14081) TaxID=559298 RepID=A0A179V146_BLAGS|nr:uncharacterized protein BDBG_08398 [Blastomyces gilchristii SLH14081]OAT13138.1 hypothetical protein BDBG_08398 [Blastomyces gilchristii SLH14081]
MGTREKTSGYVIGNNWGQFPEDSAKAVVGVNGSSAEYVERMVDYTGLPVHAGKLMNPTPDSLDYSISAWLKVPAPFIVQLDPLTINLDRAQDTPEQAYVDFTKFLFELTRTFVLAVEGTTAAYLGKLRVKVKLDKKLELNGMQPDRDPLLCPIRLSHHAAGPDMFRGFNIESAGVTLPCQEDGTNLKVVLIIMLQLPGNNTVNGDCKIDIKSAIANLVPILEGQKKALSEGNLELTANGNTTIYKGKHITYIEDVLNNITLKTSLSIIKVLTQTLRGLTEGGKGLGGILDLLKGDGFDDIMGVLREALKGDGVKDIINGLDTVLKEVVGGEGASLNDSLCGSNLKDVVGELIKLDLKELGIDEILNELKNSQS